MPIVNKYTKTTKLFIIKFTEVKLKIPNNFHIKTTLNPIRSYLSLICVYLFMSINFKIKLKLKNCVKAVNRSFFYTFNSFST